MQSGRHPSIARRLLLQLLGLAPQGIQFLQRATVHAAPGFTHALFDKAKALLEEAGYPNGEGFPVIRLLINRNEQQRIVAQSIAAMWRATLNIETEIVIRNWDEYEAGIKAGDYDIVRRGIVMQTTPECRASVIGAA